jgi:hypothetical protein
MNMNEKETNKQTKKDENSTIWQPSEVGGPYQGEWEQEHAKRER